MLDFDPVSVLHERLLSNRRPPDGLLHPSGDLIGSLRHSQLRAAGAPMIESDVVNDFRLALGTMAHAWLEEKFRSAPVMNEVKLDRWMPEGWTGTADALFWNAELRAFTLVDYKTCKPTAIPYIHKDGIKDSHLWQASCYWHAARQMGIPLVHGFGIFYLPIEQLRASDGFVQPTFAEATPLPWESVQPVMVQRWAETQRYLRSLPQVTNYEGKPLATYDHWLTAELAPVQDRVLKTYIGKLKSGPVLDVKLVPHWSTDYCPFPNELCNCREQGSNKLGHFDLNEDGRLYFVPSRNSGFEEGDDWPTLPTDDDIDRLVKAKKKEAAGGSSEANSDD